MLNLSIDRYRFAVGLGAALLRGHTSLLPPNHVADTVAAAARALSPTSTRSSRATPTSAACRACATPIRSPTRARSSAMPAIDDDLVAAYVLTSGSTGDPVPHAKPWGLLVRNAQAEASRLAARARPRQTCDGVSARRDGAAAAHVRLRIERAARPARRRHARRRAAVLCRRRRRRRSARAAAPRILVTTPFHLKTIVDAAVALPPLALVALRDGAALAAARRARRAAPRRAARRDLRLHRSRPGGDAADDRQAPSGAPSTACALEGDGDAVTVRGGHVPQPTVLADVLEVVDAQTFRLLGRSNDLDQRRRQAQLDRPPRLPSQLDRWRRRRRVLDAAGRAKPTRSASSASSPSSSRRRWRASASSPRCASASTPPSCRAASSTSTHCRAKRPASSRGARLGRARRDATCAEPRAMSDTVACAPATSTPTTRRSTATSPAGRCCPASPSSPRCSRLRGARRRSPPASATRRGSPVAKFLAPVAAGGVADDRVPPRRGATLEWRVARRHARRRRAARSRAPTSRRRRRGDEGRRRHRAAHRLGASARAHRTAGNCARCAALATVAGRRA